MINNEIREDLLITCVEGGCNYWSIFSRPEKYNNELTFSENVFDAIKKGQKIDVFDVENQDELLGFITMQAIENGEELLKSKRPDIISDIIGDSWDAETADVWLQYILFGEIVYG